MGTTIDYFDEEQRPVVRGGESPTYEPGATAFDKYKANYDWAVEKGLPWGGMDTNWQHFYEDTGPGSTAVEQRVYDTAREILGRDITEAEFYQFIPQFPYETGGHLQGKAYLGQIAQREADKAEEEGEVKDPSEFHDSVRGIFGDILGRDPSEDEIEHYSGMMAENGIDAFELKSFLRQDPEFLKQQDVAFREGLAEETLGFQEKAFGRMTPQIMSQFKRSGTQHSTALDFAMTDAAAKLEEGRQRYLSGLSAQQYGGRQGVARQDYQQQLNQYLGDQAYQRSLKAYGTQREDYIQDVYRNRAWETADYAQQARDYANWAESQGGSGTNWWEPAAGAATAVGVGAATGWNPWAMSAGYQFGSGTARSFS